jgi:hypothetical protein
MRLLHSKDVPQLNGACPSLEQQALHATPAALRW